MKKILKIIGNKYVIATLVFAVLILFLDEYNLMVTGRVSRQVDALHAEESALREAIATDSINNANLRGNLDAIEHYGRENYYMKRSNEDIFVIK
ncbi:MAG: septum formation initiator family protein [Bacteroidales bacterium]|jgi:cell division protein FtsB|nr:septum formation initiator family protein [Bacteroidales bacterium]